VPAGQAPKQLLTEVRVGGQVKSRSPLTVIPTAPGIFAVANRDGRVNTANVPAYPGEVLQIYATGQGAVIPTVDDGVAAPTQPLATSPNLPNVFLGGRQLTVLYNGLAPGFARVWQIDVMIPADAPTGPDLALTVVNGIVSNPVSVAVVR